MTERTRTILIVDDSTTLRDQLKQTLEKHQFKVLEAGNGFEGLAIIKSGVKIDMIICDLNMPEMDGLTMAENLVHDGRYTNIPIFMLTTETDKSAKMKGKAVGVLAWVTKPYEEGILIKAIEKILASKI